MDTIIIIAHIIVWINSVIFSTGLLLGYKFIKLPKKNKYSVIEKWIDNKGVIKERIVMDTNSKKAAKAFLLPYDKMFGHASYKHLVKYVVKKNR